MHLVDRHRRAARVDAGGCAARTRQCGFVEYDRCGLGTNFRGKRHRIGFQRQMLAAPADHVELVVIAGARAGDEQLPIAVAAHPHRMPPRVPEIEVADHADALRIRREHDEGHAVDAVERARMRAELVIEPLVGAFTEQIEIEVGEHRREPIGVLELDDIVAEFGAQLIALRAVRHRAGKQPGIMDARELGGCAMLVDGLDITGFGQEGAYHRLAALVVQAEIVEGIGMASLDDGIGFGGQFWHQVSLAVSDSVRSRAFRGMRSQSGRLTMASSISPSIPSSKKKLTRASVACGSAGQSRALIIA